jgi:hypothetical protein
MPLSSNGTDARNCELVSGAGTSGRLSFGTPAAGPVPAHLWREAWRRRSGYVAGAVRGSARSLGTRCLGISRKPGTPAALARARAGTFPLTPYRPRFGKRRSTSFATSNHRSSISLIRLTPRASPCRLCSAGQHIRVTRTLQLPVTLINEKPGLQLLKVPKTVHVTIDGPEGDTGIGPVQIDASGIRLGLNYCLLTHNQIPRPHGVRVKTIDPALLILEGTPR